ncbi:hypothetical protein PFISCL1PPCAC_10445, partial [Pristionchus fissidentatus]
QMLSLPAPTQPASSHLVDALPYLDTAYGETDRQHALNLIANECKVFLPTANYLKHLPVPDYDVFLTPTLMKENARMAKKEEMTKLDMSRCELPPPSSAKSGDKQAWKKSIDNARAQNEHLVVRESNLELMEEFASDGFLRRNRCLEEILHSEEEKLREKKQTILQIHAKRKAAQLEAGSKLKDGEAAWVGMLTKNYQMEMAIEQLERENVAKAKKLKIEIESL